jgi:hypothetical protein
MARARARATRNQILSDTDRRSLELAIETMRKHSLADREQIDTMLKERPWRAAAVFAATCCQERALRLKPWQAWPPCVVSIDDVDEPGFEHRGIRASAALLQAMLAAGVSRFHPDPLAAIETAEAARAKEKAPTA